jgi:hypothetical protein
MKIAKTEKTKTTVYNATMTNTSVKADALSPRRFAMETLIVSTTATKPTAQRKHPNPNDARKMSVLTAPAFTNTKDATDDETALAVKTKADVRAVATNSLVPMVLVSHKAPNATGNSSALTDPTKTAANSVADLVNTSATLASASAQAESVIGRLIARMEATRTIVHTQPHTGLTLHRPGRPLEFRTFRRCTGLRRMNGLTVQEANGNVGQVNAFHSRHIVMGDRIAGTIPMNGTAVSLSHITHLLSLFTHTLCSPVCHIITSHTYFD